jgi:hypothetical protein
MEPTWLRKKLWRWQGVWQTRFFVGNQILIKEHSTGNMCGHHILLCPLRPAAGKYQEASTIAMTRLAEPFFQPVP